MGLAKRTIKTAGNSARVTSSDETAGTLERRYVSFEEEEAAVVPRKARVVSDDRDESGALAAVQVDMREVIGPGGLLERSMIGGYEDRVAQLEMAEMGTVKTLAYLLPAICSGRRVVISTATKSLQEQLYQKDIPFLKKHFAPKLKVAVMKGRAN